MSAAGPGLSQALCEHLSSVQYDHLPLATRHATKRAILDGLGVMLAASGLSTDVQPFIALAREEAANSRSRVLGTEVRSSVALAAQANGAMAHALDYEDTFDAAPVHPNASSLPAAFALAGRYRFSGPTFMAAVAVGCDLVCRMALALRQSMETGGWFPPPILGAFGAVATAGRLLELTPQQMRDAISLLLCQNTCPGEIKYSPDTVLRGVREAFPAQAAVNSVMLAARGVRGFDTPLEGRNGFYALYAGGQFNRDELLQGLGRDFHIEQLSFKQWPCCRGTHAYIELAQQLQREHHFGGDDVDHWEMAGGEMHQMLCEPAQQKRAPHTLIDAKFSLPFCVAAALTRDEITLGTFSTAALDDPRILRLAAVASFELRKDWGRHRAASGELTLHLKDGRTLHGGLDQARGSPQHPLSDEQLRAKFIDCAARAQSPIPVARAEKLADRLCNLESEADLGTLLETACV